MARIGLVAGGGGLPIEFARAAKTAGDTVIVFGVKGLTGESVAKYADKVHWIKWGDFKKAILLVATERVSKVALLGKIKKELLFKEGALDEEASKIVKSAGGKKDYAVLNGVAGVMKKFGIDIIDPTPYLKKFIPQKGVITKRVPSASESSDIEYARSIACHMAEFDVGQTVTVKDKTVIALEAAEGTDQTIKRAGELVSGGFVVVKMARPKQDMRFDIPLVGLETIKMMQKAHATALALEEKKTLLIDTEEVVKFADENKISIIIV